MATIKRVVNIGQSLTSETLRKKTILAARLKRASMRKKAMIKAIKVGQIWHFKDRSKLTKHTHETLKIIAIVNDWCITIQYKDFQPYDIDADDIIYNYKLASEPKQKPIAR